MPANSPRRILRFASIDDAHAEVQQLAEADRAGLLRSTGNWTFGQTLNHLATWVDYAYDGAPLKVPFFIRWIMRLVKKRVLNGAMPSGSKIPGVKDGTLATEAVPASEGLAHFQKSFERLKSQAPSQPSPLFGPLTHEQWIKLHLRHAELHLSFLCAESPAPLGA